MSDNEEIKSDDDLIDEDSVYQIFVDEDNNEIPFEILDFLKYKDAEYVVLLPLEEEESEEETEVVIFKLEKSNDEEETYTVVDDEVLLEEIFEYFKERNEDVFNFSD